MDTFILFIIDSPEEDASNHLPATTPPPWYGSAESLPVDADSLAGYYGSFCVVT